MGSGEWPGNNMLGRQDCLPIKCSPFYIIGRLEVPTPPQERNVETKGSSWETTLNLCYIRSWIFDKADLCHNHKPPFHDSPPLAVIKNDNKDRI